jgi:DNA-binding XRE family transcriptional regulator
MSFFKKVTNYNKDKEYLKKELDRDPEKEELEIIGYKNVDILDNLEIDEEENEAFELKYRLGIKNNNLEKSRLEKNLLQKDIAILIGIGSATYCQIETCNYYPPEEIKIKIAEVLEKRVDYLFPEWLKIFTSRWKRAEKEKLVKISHTTLNSPEVQMLVAPENKMVDRAILKKLLDPILKELKPREQKLLDSRFGLTDGITHTYEELADEFNVTESRINQVTIKALMKLKRHPDFYKLKEYYDEI